MHWLDVWRVLYIYFSWQMECECRNGRISVRIFVCGRRQLQMGLLGLEWIDDDENECPKCVNKHKTSEEREGERGSVYTECYINTGLKATTIHNVTCQLYTQLSG